jgi:hypothetical protein
MADLLNTDNRSEEQYFTDSEFDAELLSQFPEVGPTRSAGWMIYGIDWTYENAKAWRHLEDRLAAVEFEALKAAVKEGVGEYRLIEPPEDSIPV